MTNKNGNEDMTLNMDEMYDKLIELQANFNPEAAARKAKLDKLRRKLAKSQARVERLIEKIALAEMLGQTVTVPIPLRMRAHIDAALKTPDQPVSGTRPG